MTRRIEILLESRGVRAVAELLDEEAPKTCEAVWQGLPQSGPIWHAKFANNEIFIQPGSPVPAEVREQCNATGRVDLAPRRFQRNNEHPAAGGVVEGLPWQPRQGTFSPVPRLLRELEAARGDPYTKGAWPLLALPEAELHGVPLAYVATRDRRAMEEHILR
jgi:hypothetical protein